MIIRDGVGERQKACMALPDEISSHARTQLLQIFRHSAGRTQDGSAGSALQLNGVAHNSRQYLRGRRAVEPRKLRDHEPGSTPPGSICWRSRTSSSSPGCRESYQRIEVEKLYYPASGQYSRVQNTVRTAVKAELAQLTPAQLMNIFNGQIRRLKSSHPHADDAAHRMPTATATQQLHLLLA